MAAHADARAHRVPGEHELLGRDEHVGQVTARTADVLGVPEPQDPRVGDIAVELEGELARLLPRAGVRGDALRREATNGLAERLVLLGLEEERHGRDSTRRPEELR